MWKQAWRVKDDDKRTWTHKFLAPSLVFLPLGFRSFLFLYFLLALWYYFLSDTRLRGHIPSLWCCLAYLYVLTINFLWQRYSLDTSPFFHGCWKLIIALSYSTAQKKLAFLNFKVTCILNSSSVSLENVSWLPRSQTEVDLNTYVHLNKSWNIKHRALCFAYLHHPRRAAQWHLRKCLEGPLLQSCSDLLSSRRLSPENWALLDTASCSALHWVIVQEATKRVL